jgi:hypothetical protein
MRFQSFRSLAAWLRRHQAVLWWIHSGYALAIGVGVMWIGSRNYTWLRLAVFHVAFIWATSLIVPMLVARAAEGSAWWTRARRLINYFNRNLYQQILFFVLPIYYASATWGTWNMVFVALVGAVATLSTLDLFYDHHLSVKRGVSAVFFAFNLFATVNLMLPVVWRIGHAEALWASAGLSLAAFLTIGYRISELGRRRVWLAGAATAALFAALIRWGAFLVPPAPLQLTAATVGTGFDRSRLAVQSPVTALEPGWSGRLYALTAIRAPLGLADGVAHRWYENGVLRHQSRIYRVEGGRPEGFRLWTFHQIGRVREGDRVRVDVVTDTGQLIGRVEVGTAAAGPRTRRGRTGLPESSLVRADARRSGPRTCPIRARWSPRPTAGYRP